MLKQSTVMSMYVCDWWLLCTLEAAEYSRSELLQTPTGHLLSGGGNSFKFNRSQLFYLENENHNVYLIEMLYTVGSTLSHPISYKMEINFSHITLIKCDSKIFWKVRLLSYIGLHRVTSHHLLSPCLWV